MTKSTWPRESNSRPCNFNHRANYLTYARWNTKLYWRHTDECMKASPIENRFVLPSSSTKRTEIPLIAERKFKEADKIIEKLEKEEDRDHKNREKQRKAREKAMKPKKKGWFN